MFLDYSYFTFILSLFFSLLPCILYVTCYNIKYKYLSLYLCNLLQFVFICISISLLVYNYIISNYININILENTCIDQPLLYKICGLWSNHEGSVFFWCWIASFYMLLFMLFNEYMERSFFLVVYLIQSFISFFFKCFTLFTSNPFIGVETIFFDGGELNPILQDFGLIIHPPMLYLGYVGFFLLFSVVIGILFRKCIYKSWLVIIKYAFFFPWLILTIGIFLGSWWAYHELGWGGWWFWDPVENISILPWILGLTIIHLLNVCYKQNELSTFSFLNSLLIFFMSIIGTFFVRSGLLNSVHSFVGDSFRGFFILIFLACVCLFVAYAIMKRVYYSSFISTSFIIAYGCKYRYLFSFTFILFFLYCVILIGTISPLLFDLIFKRDISIGPGFYNEYLLIALIPCLFLLGISFYPTYKKRSAIFLSLYCSVPFLLILIIAAYFTIDLIIILYYFSICTVWVILVELFKQYRVTFLFFVHSIFLLLLLSVIIYSYFQTNLCCFLKIGDVVTLHDYNFLLLDVNEVAGRNYHSQYGHLIVYNQKDSIITHLYPERRFYFESLVFSSKAFVVSNYISDIYVIFGEGNYIDGWNIKIYYNPMINIIWYCSILIVFISVFFLLKRNKYIKLFQ